MLLTTLNKIVVFILFISINSYAKSNCESHSLKYKWGKKLHQRNLILCSNDELNTHMSPNCEEGKCDALKFTDVEFEYKGFGLPGSGLCKVMDGTIYYYQMENKKVLSQCYMKSDKSYIDLLSLYKKYSESKN